MRTEQRGAEEINKGTEKRTQNREKDKGMKPKKKNK